MYEVLYAPTLFLSTCPVSQVNADRVFWRVDDNHEVTGMILRQDRHVGKAISTKAVGSDEREDITNHYKYPEGKSACVFT